MAVFLIVPGVNTISPDDGRRNPLGPVIVYTNRVEASVEIPSAPETLLLNIAIIPSDYVALAALDLSRQTLSQDGLFCLDDITRFSHITLYMARFQKDQVNNIIAESKSLVSGFRQQFLKQVGYFVTAGDYYEISYERAPGLLEMHEATTQRLAPFRCNPRNPHREEYFGAYSNEQRINAIKWGYDLAGNLYRPHITITRFPEGFSRLRELPKAPNSLSFTATKIGLFEADNLGAARRPITTVELIS